MAAPTLRIREIRFGERAVRLRLPFRFGAATVTETKQVFVHVELSLIDGQGGFGQSAELMVPKWFDKSPDLSNADNVDQLRRALALARSAYLAAGKGTAFGLHAALEQPLHVENAKENLPGLIASFGQSLVDRAILDALCRIEGKTIAECVRTNRPGIDATTAPDLQVFDLERFLSGLHPAATIAARHTVGMADPLRDSDITAGARLSDGLPQSLEAVVATYNHRFFKLKLGGDVQADLARLTAIAAVLDEKARGYTVTLDGNEQYPHAEMVEELVTRMAETPKLAGVRAGLAFIEQPINRAVALSAPIHGLAARVAVEIDESDGDIEAFPRARALGYTGVSSKSCKGFYRALINRARVARWNAEAGADKFFMSAEDLTTQSGIAVQQDLALAALIGMTHVERNGHHYVDGMAGAPEAEQAAFRAAHPDLYATSNGRTRLSIRQGDLALGTTLAAQALGTEIEPDWRNMTNLSTETAA